MNLGLSIFLSTILICSVWLYYITRDRWKWKKILKWVGFSVLFLGFVLTSIFLFKRYYNESMRSTSNEIPELSHIRLDSLLRKELEESSKSQLKKLTDLEGIALRESQNDVKFVKGKPLYIRLNPEYWVYEYKGNSDVIGDNSYKYAVLFNNKEVISVIKSYSLSIGVSLRDRVRSFFAGSKARSPKDIILRWGKPTSKFDFDNGLKKLFFYSNFNLVLIFEKNEVTYNGIYLPEYENTIKKLISSNPSFLF